MRIAQKLTGNPDRYHELVVANPNKQTARSQGQMGLGALPPTFQELYEGETLQVPATWTQGIGSLGGPVPVPKTRLSKGDWTWPNTIPSIAVQQGLICASPSPWPSRSPAIAGPLPPGQLTWRQYTDPSGNIWGAGVAGVTPIIFAKWDPNAIVRSPTTPSYKDTSIGHPRMLGP